MHELAAHELRDRFCQGKVSAKEIVTASLKRIDQYNDQIGAFLTVLSDRALAKAKELDDKRAQGAALGKLAGVPIAIKDNIHIKGERSSCGSKFLTNFIAPFDSTVVRLLEAEGAIIVGKTNMDEFAMGSSTENSALLRTGNPWDLALSPGGSSGGSAAAVAARLVPCALGSDTGGSIRQPAALCGVVGMKPTYGRVSRFGLVAFGSSLDQIGPLATTTQDISMIMEVIGKHCDRDSTSFTDPSEKYLSQLDDNLSGWKVGVPYQFLEGLGSAPRACFDTALEKARECGAEIVDVDLDILKYAIATYYILATAEASTNLARFDGVRYGVRSSAAKTLDEVYDLSKQEGFGPEVKRRIMLGTFVLSAGYQDAYYKKAQKVRTLMIQKYREAFNRCHVVAMPTAPTPAFAIGSIKDPLQMYLEDIYTISANLAGLPAISVPIGFVDELPYGIQLIGPQKHDVAVCHAAYAVEKATDASGRAPPSFENSGGGGEMSQRDYGPWKPVIGLEIHAELNTKSKLFSMAPNRFGDEPNTNITEVCTGQPGALPVLNKEAVRKAVQLGCALRAEVCKFSKFDRKSYFYPDSPRNFQITQLDEPIVRGGEVVVEVEGEEKVFAINRVHLEDDAGMLKHFSTFAGVDYNRAGVPLVEIVSEPCLHTPKEAAAYAMMVRAILQYLDVSDCNMEEGSLRFDANISVMRVDEGTLREKTEIKNMNSFSNMELALEAEIDRQIKAYESDPRPPEEVITPATYRWDPETKTTKLMRRKESADDYRYFPEPDLVPVVLTDAFIDDIRRHLPELPLQRERRYMTDLQLSPDTAFLLASDKGLSDYFEGGLATCSNARSLANWILIEFAGRIKDSGKSLMELGITTDNVAALVNMIDKGTITGRIAKQVADDMIASPGVSCRDIVSKNPDYQPLSDTGTIEPIVDEVLAENPQSVADFQSGRTKAFAFLVGQVMKQTRGKASPQVVNELLLKKIGN